MLLFLCCDMNSIILEVLKPCFIGSFPRFRTTTISSILHAINLSENRILHTKTASTNTTMHPMIKRERKTAIYMFIFCLQSSSRSNGAEVCLFEYNHSQVAVIRKQMIISFLFCFRFVFSNTF